MRFCFNLTGTTTLNRKEVCRAIPHPERLGLYEESQELSNVEEQVDAV